MKIQVKIKNENIYSILIFMHLQGECDFLFLICLLRFIFDLLA
jgi:hypothetical protein